MYLNKEVNIHWCIKNIDQNTSVYIFIHFSSYWEIISYQTPFLFKPVNFSVYLFPYLSTCRYLQIKLKLDWRTYAIALMVFCCIVWVLYAPIIIGLWVCGLVASIVVCAFLRIPIYMVLQHRLGHYTFITHKKSNRVKLCNKIYSEQGICIIVNTEQYIRFIEKRDEF